MHVSGALYLHLHWSCQYDVGRAVLEHHFGHQLSGLFAEEELAERACPLHQEHHGPGAAHFLVFHVYVGPNKSCYTLDVGYLCVYICVNSGSSF